MHTANHVACSIALLCHTLLYVSLMSSIFPKVWHGLMPQFLCYKFYCDQICSQLVQQSKEYQAPRQRTEARSLKTKVRRLKPGEQSSKSKDQNQYSYVFQALGFGLRALVFGLWCSSFGRRALVFGLWISDLWLLT